MNTLRIPLTHEQLTDYPNRKPMVCDFVTYIKCPPGSTDESFQRATIDAIEAEHERRKDPCMFDRSLALGVVANVDEFEVLYRGSRAGKTSSGVLDLLLTAAYSSPPSKHWALK